MKATTLILIATQLWASPAHPSAARTVGSIDDFPCPPSGLVPKGLDGAGAMKYELATADIICLTKAARSSVEPHKAAAIRKLRELAVVRYKDKLMPTSLPLSAAVPALEEALSDSKTYIRLSAAEALAAIAPSHKKALPVLLVGLREGEATEGAPRDGRWTIDQAARGLGHMGKHAQEAVPALVKLLKDKDGLVKLSAARALLEIDPSVPEIVPALSDCLASEHPGLPDAAAQDLRKLGPKAAGAVPALIRVVEKGTGNPPLAAIVTLGSIGPGADPAVSAIVRYLERSGRPSLEISALIDIGTDASLAALLALPRDEWKHQALSSIILRDRSSWVEAFLHSGFDANSKNALGATLLHYAAMQDRRKIATILLDKGADMNAVDTYGATPLHYAVQYNQPSMVKFLLKVGADPSLRSMAGTPLDIAVKYGRKEIIQLLKEGSNH